MSNENDCALMVGRYAEGTLIPSATDEIKNIAVGGMQICSINVHNNRQYPCCWTKSGAIENCKSYCSRAAEHSAHPTLPTSGENSATWVIDPNNITPPAISG